MRWTIEELTSTKLLLSQTFQRSDESQFVRYTYTKVTGGNDPGDDPNTETFVWQLDGRGHITKVNMVRDDSQEGEIYEHEWTFTYKE
jgi:hypothetical protein